MDLLGVIILLFELYKSLSWVNPSLTSNDPILAEGVPSLTWVVLAQVFLELLELGGAGVVFRSDLESWSLCLFISITSSFSLALSCLRVSIVSLSSSLSLVTLMTLELDLKSSNSCLSNWFSVNQKPFCFCSRSFASCRRTLFSSNVVSKSENSTCCPAISNSLSFKCFSNSAFSEKKQ